MKGRNKLLAILLLAFLLGGCSIFGVGCKSTPEQTSAEQPQSINPYDYEVNSRERYVASLAQQEDISFEAADQKEKEQAADLVHAGEEEIRYCTIDKFAGSVENGKGYSESVHIAAEVRCVYNNEKNEMVSIADVIYPDIYIPNASGSTIDCDDLSVTQDDSAIHISTNAEISLKLTDEIVNSGGDIIDVSLNEDGCTIKTESKYFEINIDAEDLFKMASGK